jgi:hypothetical protein
MFNVKLKVCVKVCVHLNHYKNRVNEHISQKRFVILKCIVIFEETNYAATSSTASSMTSSTTSSENESEMETVPLSQFVYRRSIGTLGQRFEDWLELFDLYLVAKEKYSEYLRYCKIVEWMGAIKKGSLNPLNDGPRRSFSLLGLNIECLVDTGAPVSIIDEATFNNLSPRPTLSKCKTTIHSTLLQ